MAKRDFQIKYQFQMTLTAVNNGLGVIAGLGEVTGVLTIPKLLVVTIAIELDVIRFPGEESIKTAPPGMALNTEGADCVPAALLS